MALPRLCPFPDCYYCNLLGAAVPIADRCELCLDDWICDWCALAYGLSDPEATDMEVEASSDDEDCSGDEAVALPRPCPFPDCYYCSLMDAAVPIADRCDFCLDDWICDGCALEYDLSDPEDMDVEPDVSSDVDQIYGDEDLLDADTEDWGDGEV